MRSALGLILGCFVAAVVIAGVFFFVLAPRADLAAPQTVAARLAEPLLLPAAKLAAKDDVEITAAISTPRADPASASRISSRWISSPTRKSC
jgi:hypothetical protein